MGRKGETKEDAGRDVMSSGLSYSMPLLLINLGGEMLYILEQRLTAQKITPEKSARVLCDVVRTMFSRRFVSELFKPQWIYSDMSIRQIFDKLAHSSIMKLNETSMSKLYSLMVMGVKYQLLRCVQPARLLDVTLQHIAELKAMCNSAVTDELLADCRRQCEATYGRFTCGDWVLCKQQLSQFFQGHKVRVSLFLQQDIQAMDGTLALDAGGSLPEGADPPGTLRTFALGSTKAQSATRLTHPLTSAVNNNPRTDQDDHGAALAVALGSNMYLRTPDGTPAAAVPTNSSRLGRKTRADDDAKGSSSAGHAKAESITRQKAPPQASTTSAELNLLASLLGGCGDDDDKDAEVFRFELFDGDATTAAPPLDVDAAADAYYAPVIQIDGTAQRKTVRDLMRDLDLDGPKDESKVGAKGGLDDDDDDLLALMDSAK